MASNNLTLAVNSLVTHVAQPAQAALNIVKYLERGDADSSGSTIRTGLVVALLVTLMMGISAAVLALGGRVGIAMSNVRP